MVLAAKRPQYEGSLFFPALTLKPFFDLRDVLLPAPMMTILSPDDIPDWPGMDLLYSPTKETSDFEVKVDVKDFQPEELEVKAVDNHIVLTGKHEEKADEGGLLSRQIMKKYAIPKGVNLQSVTCNLGSDGVLLISAPRSNGNVIAKAPAEIEVKIPISLTPRPVAISQPSTSSAQEETKIEKI